MAPVPPPSKHFWREFTALEEHHRTQGVDVDLVPSELQRGALELWIVTDAIARGGGHAETALVAVCALADKHNLTLRLVASPTDRAPGLPDAEWLARWYEKHGFVRLGNVSGGIPMRRDPVS